MFAVNVEKISLKQRVVGHIRKTNLAPQWPKMELQSTENFLAGRLSLRNVWCEFEKHQLKTLRFTVYTRKTPFGPLVATNGIAECPKSIGV